MMLPTTVVVNGTVPQTERNVTPVRGQSEQKNPSVISEPIKTTTTCITRIQQASMRVLLLVTCLFYLSSALFAVNVGLFSINSFVEPLFDRAVDEFQAQSSNLHKEQILYGRLDKLLSSRLSRGFMETHEDCLVRGLRQANDELLGLGLQYPDMRVQVMEWTMENCGRLQYTPQVVIQDPTPKEAVLAYWTGMSYRSRRMLEGTLGVVPRHARWIWHHLWSAIFTPDASILTEHVSTDVNTDKMPPSDGSFPKVPFGFALRCEPSRPCSLIFPLVSSLQSDKVNTSPKVIAKLERRIKQLAAFKASLQIGLSTTWQLASVLDFVNYTLLGPCIATQVAVVIYIIAMSRPVPRIPRILRRLDESEKSFLKYLGVFYVQRTVLDLYIKYATFLPYDELVVCFGMFMLLLGSSMVVQFFLVSISSLPDMFQLSELIKELYCIVQGREVPGGEDTHPKLSLGYVINTGTPEAEAPEGSPTATETDSSLVDHRQYPQSLQTHHHSASPTTSHREEIKAYKKSFHTGTKTQQADESDVQSDYGTDVDTESDTEPDTENSDFVDLAGGVTPQLTDMGSGWSMVDA